ncbi:MAG: CinA family protein [Pseudomonadota bacterium]
MTVLEILEALRARRMKITAAESCTGGLVAAAITDIPGSSEVFERGFVTYSNAAKREMLGVSQESLATFGAVSEEVVREMALGALDAARADIAIAISGIAGPGGSEFKPEGRVCFGLAQAGRARSHTIEFGALGREKVRRAARAHAFTLIAQALQP